MTGHAYQSARIINARMRNLKSLVLNLVDKPVAVLGYHRVTTAPSGLDSLAVSPDNFRAQMNYLRHNFRIVRFGDDWSSVQKPTVAVTFDDGYADNAIEALPILEELEIPATFFISTDTLETGNEFWWEKLDRLVLRGLRYPPHFALEDVRHGRIWPTARPEERQGMFQDLLSLMMRVNAGQREEWFAQLMGWGEMGGPAEKANRPLTKAELRDFAKSKWVSIGAHTVSHSSLAALSADEQRQEIVSSKQMLEALLEKEISIFSYPFGTRHDYNRTTLRLCREAGYRKAATAFPGLYYHWSDPYQIPRHFIHNWDTDSFSVKMKGLWI